MYPSIPPISPQFFGGFNGLYNDTNLNILELMDEGGNDMYGTADNTLSLLY